MEIQNEALRAYHKGKIDDIPLILFCPVDDRKYPYANLKRLYFFTILEIFIQFYTKNIIS